MFFSYFQLLWRLGHNFDCPVQQRNAFIMYLCISEQHVRQLLSGPGERFSKNIRVVCMWFLTRDKLNQKQLTFVSDEHWKKKLSHFDLKIESLAELKFDLGFGVIGEYLSQIDSILSQFNWLSIWTRNVSFIIFGWFM